mmetsp:Transcript_26365/g.54964  ORF Transcript_26365/g.54964 Transcript_26365/m.54964 type:complete len:294 (-) Transcript_26365:434-1315(-)
MEASYRASASLYAASWDSRSATTADFWEREEDDSDWRRAKLASCALTFPIRCSPLILSSLRLSFASASAACSLATSKLLSFSSFLTSAIAPSASALEAACWRTRVSWAERSSERSALALPRASPACWRASLSAADSLSLRRAALDLMSSISFRASSLRRFTSRSSFASYSVLPACRASESCIISSSLFTTASLSCASTRARSFSLLSALTDATSTSFCRKDLSSVRSWSWCSLSTALCTAFFSLSAAELRALAWSSASLRRSSYFFSADLARDRVSSYLRPFSLRSDTVRWRV